MSSEGIIRYLEDLYGTWLEGRLGRKLLKQERADVRQIAEKHTREFEELARGGAPEQETLL